MEKIKRFFECLIPVTACNLKCSYCYVIQRNNRKNQMANLKYSPEQIGRALNKDRLGGTCYFSICGAGETTLQKQLEDIVCEILKNGHYVNITTNGTVTKRIHDIIDKCNNYTARLNFSFSFHYLELKNKKLLDTFFENIKYVRKSGCSFVLQLNLCDEYIPHIEEIKEISMKKVGAYPQIAATRKEDGNQLRKTELLTSLPEDKYIEVGKEFNSPLFEFTMNNFNVKRKEFCYAGDWSAILDLSTGIMRRCYSSFVFQDIFKNPDEKIKFLAIGNKCGSAFCMNSSHFMSLGVIPEINTPSYADLRNREEADWYNNEMKEFLNEKLINNNEEYTKIKKIISNFVGTIDNCIRVVHQSRKSYRNKKNETDK
jgi:radical SAM domain protein